jgi:hypothetical protein
MTYGHVARTGETRTRDKILVGKPEEKALLRKVNYVWENKLLKLILKECGVRMWIGLV